MQPAVSSYLCMFVRVCVHYLFLAVEGVPMPMRQERTILSRGMCALCVWDCAAEDEIS